MSLIQGTGGGLGGAGAPGGSLGSFYGHTIGQSLRFEEAGSSYLTFTPSSNGTDNKRYTFSVWIKLAQGSGDFRTVFSSKNTGSGTGQGHNTYAFGTDDDFELYTQNGGANPTSPRLYRDPNSWYHFLVVYDTTQSTDTDRVKVYVNGTQQTDYTGTFPGLNSVMASVNTNGQEQRWGRYVSSFTRYFNGYMAEIHMVDGQALDPTSFGETKDGVWVPKQYVDNGTTSHGVNGYHLDFADNTAIGNDVSGNNNDFTASGLNAHDVVPDSPNRNFATMNPLMVGGANTQVHASAAYAEGNLKVLAGGYSTSTVGGGFSSIAIPSDKKIYVEVCETNSTEFGAGVLIQDHVQNNTQIAGNGSIAYYNRSVMINGTETDYGSSAGAGGLGVARLAAGDVLGIAVDGATGKVWFHRNGTYFKSPSANDSGTTGNPSAGSNEIGTVTNTTAINPSGELFFFLTGNSSTDNLFINFGQDSTFAGNKSAGSETDANGEGLFQYAVPTDYVCLHSGNMSDPAIGPGQSSQADDYFNTVLYSGNATARSITGIGFQADWLWFKNRNSTQHHNAFDSVRGNDKLLYPNLTNAEATTTHLTSFDSDGFTLGTNTSVNGNSKTFVTWCWKAGGSASSNEDGSITSSVSVNDTAKFSIGTYTGNGTVGATVGHGLGVAPNLLIIKNRSAAQGWPVKVAPPFAGGTRLQLESTADSTTESSGSGSLYNATNPSSSVITLGDQAMTNTNTNNYVFYAFANVDGYCKSASYIGNGNANGTFVYTGFRPAFVLLKVSSTTNNWFIYDNKREGYNQDNDTLSPNLTAAEDNSYKLDLLSNGFKIRGSQNAHNHNGQTFIYLAFAEAPFKFANAR